MLSSALSQKHAISENKEIYRRSQRRKRNQKPSSGMQLLRVSKTGVPFTAILAEATLLWVSTLDEFESKADVIRNSKKGDI